MTNENKKPNKWEGHPLVPITAFGLVGVLGLVVAGTINYGINSYHVRRLQIPKEETSIKRMICPNYEGKWLEIEKQMGLKKMQYQELDENNNCLVDSLVDSTEFIYRNK